MKVVLLQDVRGVGKKYDIKVVSDGYGNNMLLPKGLAKVATPQAVAQIEGLKKDEEGKQKVHKDLVKKNLESIEGKTVALSAKANYIGHLFASLHANEIAKAIKAETEIDIDPSWIELPKPIKKAGEHSLTISVPDVGLTATFKLLVQ